MVNMGFEPNSSPYGGDGGNWDRKFWFGRGVFVIEAFQDAGEGKVECVLGR